MRVVHIPTVYRGLIYEIRDKQNPVSHVKRICLRLPITSHQNINIFLEKSNFKIFKTSQNFILLCCKVNEFSNYAAVVDPLENLAHDPMHNLEMPSMSYSFIAATNTKY